MNNISLISENDNSTVLAEYTGLNRVAASYQSESALEKELIKTLVDQGYEYLPINNEVELILNLRRQLEKLNNYHFTDLEWEYFFTKVIANKNDYIIEKTRLIQEDYKQELTLESGEKRNIYLIDKNNIHNNSVQVINQYVNNAGNRDNRYDVTILVNGLPLVHIELKKRGVDLREAFNQIERYQRDSFWEGSGLYNFVQIFVISNGTLTKYYSNTTRNFHINNQKKKKSNSFEFTSYWADQKNNGITDLIDFAKTFFTKHTLLNVLTKYCVFTSEEDLLVMRPYQIVATEKILNRIKIAYNNKFYGKINAGGYIWHTTGSGKTLTSFKTSQLASKLNFIDKVLFVVDRKDLDYQTMKEYDRFKEGAANSNTSTKVLEEQLNDPNAKIIITTIQKLSQFIKKNADSEVFNKHVVFIFDECHRSQFGEMHKSIIKKFKKYYIFGFTGTPIFPENARTIKGISETTEQVFGERLHTYTIVNAIADKNVLPFRYEYVGRVDIRDNIKDEKVYNIDEEKIFDNQMRICLITNYIIDHFSIKTKTSESYVYSTLDNVVEVAKRRDILEVKIPKNINGFNSIFAVSNIKMAKEYYEEFKRAIEIKNCNLKVALIYSYGINGEDGVIDENSESTEALSTDDRTFLDNAIKDYNKMFGTSYDTSSERFQNYYKDVSLRMKNREIDILIVANMFLTGFDAKTLNTLWVDKNLKWHGLIQAFSRTNRILNSVKTYGNIVSFRNLEDRLNEALAKFGDEEAHGVVLLKPYKDYYYGYEDDNGKKFDGYKELVEKLMSKFIPGELIQSEQEQKEFIKLYGAILKVTNILSSFDEFKDEELINERDKQDYHSIYIELYNEFRNRAKRDKVDVSEDVVFEMELIKSIEVNIDYILGLVKKYHESNMKDKEILVTIQKTIMASPDLRNKKDLIMAFIDSLDQNSDVYSDFESFMNSKKKEELDKIISDEGLNKEETYNFIRRSFEQGRVETNGTEVSNILPPMNMFTPTNDRQEKKNKVINKLLEFFDKFFSISSNKM
ncbi:MAG: type I restriction endonuclease subunit R [Bacilli bacterium]|nr:type I restriction endonuclease subunit R [Bacilli bacterium]